MQNCFIRQIRVAARRKLPLVVHSRDAVSDVLQILRRHLSMEHPIHLHSFQGTPEELQEFLDGWPNGYIGVTGAVTWMVANRPGGLNDICRATPLDRLLLETDGPFMAPQ